MKRWFIRLGCCLAGLLFLIAVYAIIERLRGRSALNKFLKVLSSKGERLAVADYEPADPPSGQNAFDDILALTNQLRAVVKSLDAVVPSLPFTAPGRAIAVSQLDRWSNDGKTTNTWDDLNAELEKGQDMLSALHAAILKPGYKSKIDYHKGFVDMKIDGIGELKSGCQLLNRACLSALRRRDLESAHRNLLAMIRLTAKQSPEPLAISQLVRMACATIAFNTTWQTLQIQGWNDTQLATLQSAWESCDFERDMTTAFEMERAMELEYFAMLKGSGPTLASVIRQLETANEVVETEFHHTETHGFILHWFHCPFWRMAWADQDSLVCLLQWQQMIERARIANASAWSALLKPIDTPSARHAWMPLIANKESWNKYNRLRFLISGGPFGIGDRIIFRALSSQTQQQMAIAAIAIQRYRLKTGEFPPALDALIPAYLPQLPQDRMDGKTLRYRRKTEGGFLLYSAGEDGKDDGGNPGLPTDKKEYRKIWDGMDAVWPMAATREETMKITQ